MFSSPLFVIGWSMIGFAVNFPMLVFARVLTGFCCGVVTPSAQVYVSILLYAITISWMVISLVFISNLLGAL